MNWARIVPEYSDSVQTEARKAGNSGWERFCPVGVIEKVSAVSPLTFFFTNKREKSERARRLTDVWECVCVFACACVLREE